MAEPTRDSAAPPPHPRGFPAWVSRLLAVPMGGWARAAWIYIAAFLLIEAVLGPASELGNILDLIGFVPVSAATALALWSASRAATEPGFRRGFGFYAASFAVTSVGTMIWSAQMARDVDPTYSWPNIPYLLSYPLAIAGVLAFPRPRGGGAERTKLLLDGAVAVVAGLALTWSTVIVPLAGSDPDPWHRILLLVYPVGDLIIFAVLVPLLLAPRARHGVMLQLLAVGQALYLLGDIGYQLGSSPEWLRVDWPNIPFLAGYGTMIWAAEAFTRRPGGDPAAELAGAPAARNQVPLLLGAVVYLLLFRQAVSSWVPTTSLLALAAVVLTGLIVVREAVTDREALALAAALEARRGEERLGSIIRHLRVGVVLQGPGAELLVANPAALDLLGLEERELAGRTSFDPAWNVIHEDGTPFPGSTHPVPVAIATGRPVRDVVMGVFRPRRGDRVWLLVDAEPEVGPRGEVRQVLCTFHDITERRALEAQLRQSQRMEAVGQLAGGVAHDFNNLLTAIIGYATMLQEGTPAEDPRRADIDEVRKAADRAAALTQQLLAFGRRQMLQPVVLDLAAVVHDAERLLARLLGEDIRIVLELAPGLGRVRVDRGQLEQVIVNLAVNARDAMPRGGRLTLAARNVAAGDPSLPAGVELPDGPVVLLEVRDTGVGMDEAIRARAFEPFFTTKEVGKGTGLGLATVYGIVRQSGGEAWIRSAPGQGTTVAVALPATPAEAARPRGPNLRRRRGGKKPSSRSRTSRPCCRW